MFPFLKVLCLILMTRKAVTGVTYSKTNYTTQVELYDGDHYGGKSAKVNVVSTLNGGNGASLQKINLGHGVSSFKIVSGSCIELHKKFPFDSTNHDNWYWTIGYFHEYGWDPEFDTNFDNKVQGVYPCIVETRVLRCPENHFVEQMRWDKFLELRNGIELHCVSAKSKNERVVIRSHGSGRLGDRSQCSNRVLRGINLKTSGTRQIAFNLEHQGCKKQAGKSTKTSDKSEGYSDTINHLESTCPVNQALIGLEIDLERNSNYVKKINILCGVVKNPLDCVPSDRYTPVLTCDGTKAKHAFTCSNKEAIGLEKKTAISEEENWQRELSIDYFGERGFDLEVVSASFTRSNGKSNTTGYVWSKVDDSVFTSTSSTTVEAEVPPGCVISYLQLIGECSYVQVKLNKFDVTEECAPGTVTARKQLVYIEGRGWFY